MAEKGEKSTGVEVLEGRRDSDNTLVEQIERGPYKADGSLRKRPLLGFVEGDQQYLKASRFQTIEDEGDAEIQYRTLVWWKAAALMLAETVSLGVLSLPSFFAAVGFPAGVILTLGLGTVATYTGYNIGLFKQAYPGVQNMADAGHVMFGPAGEWILGISQIILVILICASHVLTGLIALDTISASATCAIVWAVIIAAVAAVCTIPRTFHGLAWLSVVSFVSIISAMIGVGVAGHKGHVSATVSGVFHSQFLGVTNFPKALVFLQISDTTIYVTVGSAVYAYVGSQATSPAISNLGMTLARIAYGISLPTILIAGVINGSVVSKLIMQRIFVRYGKPPSRHYTSNTVFGWSVWLGIVGGVWTLAFIIAEVIPFFNDLLSVISSLFASWFTYGLSGVFYFFFTPKHVLWESKGRIALTSFNILLIVSGAFITVAGMYSAAVGIQEGYQSGSFGGPFSCKAPSSS